MILVINREQTEAEDLRQLIEFMDNTDVHVATPAGWQDELGTAELEALFLGADLCEQDVNDVLTRVSEIDPDVPIVLMQDDA